MSLSRRLSMLKRVLPPRLFDVRESLQLLRKMGPARTKNTEGDCRVFEACTAVSPRLVKFTLETSTLPGYGT